MSQFPPVPPTQPPAGLPYDYALYPSPRPGVITGISITAIVLGSLGLLCNGIGVIFQGIVLAFGGKNPLIPAAPVINNPPLLWYGAGNAVLALILSIALLAGGIGGLKLRPWARSGMIKWSLVTILWATLSMILQVTWVNPATTELVLNQQAHSSRAAPPNMVAGYRVGQIVGSVAAWVLWCVMPVLFLSLWRSQRVVSAFDANSDAPPQLGA